VSYFCVFQDLRTKNWKLIEEIQLAPTRNATNNKLSSDPNSLLMNNEKVVSFSFLICFCLNAFLTFEPAANELEIDENLKKKSSVFSLSALETNSTTEN
jgi:hypothetical protein